MVLSRETLVGILASGLAAAVAFLAPIPGGCQGQIWWAVAAALAVLLGAVAIVGRRLAGGARPRVDPVMIALACLAGAWAVQLLPLPAVLVGLVSPARLRLAREVAAAAGDGAPVWLSLTTCLKCTRDGLLLLVACSCAFGAASALADRPRLWRPVLGAVVASGALLAAWGILEVLRDRGGRLASTWTNANRFAGLMAIAGAAAVGLFIAEARGGGGRRARDGFGLPWGWWWLAGGIVCETALVLTLSRLGIASAAVAGLLGLAVFGRRTRAAWAAPAGALVLVAANACLATGPVLGRYSVLFEGGRVGGGRARCWAMALGLVRDHPLVGSGSGTFKHAFLMYQDPSLGGWWDYAHNDWLNVLADGGIVSLAALMAAAVFFYRGVMPLRTSPDPATRGAALAGFLALSAGLLHSLGDYPLRQPANALALALVCGVAWGRARAGAATTAAAPASAPPPAPPPRWERPVRAALAGALCLVTLPLLVRLAAAGRLADAAEAIPVGRDERPGRASLERRLSLLERAARLDPWDASVRREAARTRVRLVVDGSGARGAEHALRTADRELAEARAVSPLDPRAFYLAAVVDWRPGASARADRMMAFALELAPAWPDVTFQVGSHFLARWLAEREEAQGDFGFARLARRAEGDPAAAAPDALFKAASRALSLAARSEGARADAVALVIRSGLSPGEIDSALGPDAATDLALANGLAARGLHERAAARYARALESGGPPNEARVRSAYAASLMKLGRTAEALGQLDAALAGAARSETARTVRELASARAPPEAAGAVADFWAERARPGGALAEEPLALMALGRAELAAGREREGFDHLLAYAEAAGDAGAYAELASVALARREHALAARLAAEAARLAPEDPLHGMLLARALSALGDADGARAALSGVLARRPRDAAATRALAELEAGASRHDMAIRAWRRFLDSGGDPAPAHEAIADIYLAISDRARAEEELARAAHARPGDARLRKRLEDLRSGSEDGAPAR